MKKVRVPYCKFKYIFMQICLRIPGVRSLVKNRIFKIAKGTGCYIDGDVIYHKGVGYYIHVLHNKIHVSRYDKGEK